jgi:hypothetical protein
MADYFPLLLLACIPAYIIYSNWLAQRHFRNELIWYAQRTTPIFEVTRTPTDREEYIRKDEHDKMLILSGNQFNIPVIVIAWRGHDEQGNVGALFGDFYTSYRVEVGRRVNLATDQWHEQILKQDNEAYQRALLQRQMSQQYTADQNQINSKKNQN